MGGILRIFFSKIQFLKKVTRSTLGGEMHVDALGGKIKNQKKSKKWKEREGGGMEYFHLCCD